MGLPRPGRLAHQPLSHPGGTGHLEEVALGGRSRRDRRGAHFVGLLGLIGIPGALCAWPVSGFASSATGTRQLPCRSILPCWPRASAPSPTSTAACAGPPPPTSGPRPWRTIRRCSPPAPAWRPSPATGRRLCATPPWSGAGGEITLAFVEVQIRSALSVPVELGGGPIGTLDVYGSEPRGWDDSEVTAVQTYAGWWPACSGRRPRRSSRAPWPTSSRPPWIPGRTSPRPPSAERLQHDDDGSQPGA
jgi:hypothetical protein